MHGDHCLSNFYEDCMSSLSTICHSASSVLERNFSVSIKLEGISSPTYKRIPPLFERRSNLNGLLKPSIKNFFMKGDVNFCLENYKYINITFNLIFK